MWLINVVIIFSYLCILSALIYKAVKSKELIDISVIVISLIVESVFISGIFKNINYPNALQFVIFIFAYLIPMLFVYIKYTTISIKLKLVYFIANLCFKFRRYEVCNMLLEKIIKKDPKNVKYYEFAAKSYERQEKYIEARDKYFKITELMPDNARAYYNLGLMFDELNKKDTALIMFATAIGLDPEYNEAKEMQGIIYSEIGRYLEATNIYEELKEKGTKNYKIYYNLGTIYLEKGDIDNAKESYEQAVLLNKNLYEAWFALGNIYYTKNDYEGALIALKKAIKDDQIRAKGNYSMAKVYLKMDDLESSVECIEIAAKLDGELIIKASNDILFETILPEINRIKDDLIELEVAEYDPESTEE